MRITSKDVPSTIKQQHNNKQVDGNNKQKKEIFKSQVLRIFSFDPLNPRISCFYKQLDLPATLLIDSIFQTTPSLKYCFLIRSFEPCLVSHWLEDSESDQ